jgi:hypothetical protein
MRSSSTSSSRPAMGTEVTIVPRRDLPGSAMMAWQESAERAKGTKVTIVSRGTIAIGVL